MEINPTEPQKSSTAFSTTSFLISRNLLQIVGKIHGDFGSAAIASGFSVKYCNEYTRVALVRVRSGPHKLLASAIPFLNSFDKKKVTVNLLYTGATIKHCVEFIKRYQRRKIETELVEFRNKPEYESLCRMYLNINPAYTLR